MSGEIGLPSKPLRFNGEQWKLETRTSDPASTRKGEAWLRTDLAPATDQLGTLRFDHGGGTWDIPIFDASVAPDNTDVKQVLRIPIAGTTGYIPIIPRADAEFQQLSFQHAGSKYGLHNVSGAIPDSAVNRWTFSEGSGTTVADSVGTDDLTFNELGWVTDTWQDGEAGDLDGSNDEGTAPTKGPSGSFSVAFTIEADSLADFGYIVSNYITGNPEFYTRVQDGNKVRVFLRTDTASAGVETATLSTGTKYRIVAVWDESTNTWSVHRNTTEDASTTISGAYDPADTNDITVGNLVDVSDDHYDGRVDDIILYDDALSSGEIQSDYDAQPWT